MTIEQANRILLFPILGYGNTEHNVFRYAMQHFTELREEWHEISILWCAEDGTPETPDEVTFDYFSKRATPEEAKDARISIFTEKEVLEDTERYGIYFYLPAINNVPYYLNLRPGDNATLCQYFEEGQTPNFIVPAEPFAYLGGGWTSEEFLEEFEGQPDYEEAKNAIINGYPFWYIEAEKCIFLIADGTGRETEI